MRAVSLVAGLLLLTQGQMPRAYAQAGSVSGINGPRHVQSCTITAVDTVLMNFLCRTKDQTRQFWITRGTRFLTRGTRGSFFDLQAGPVEVTSHHSGAIEVADRVVSRPAAR